MTPKRMTSERLEEIREAFEVTPEPERNPEDVAIGELLAALGEAEDEKENDRQSIRRRLQNVGVQFGVGDNMIDAAVNKITRACEVVEAARIFAVGMSEPELRLEKALKRHDEEKL